MAKWAEMATELRSLIALRTFPLGMKFLKKAKDLEIIPKLRVVGKELAHVQLCSVMTFCRTSGITVGIRKDTWGRSCRKVTGFDPWTESDSKALVGYWLNSKKDAVKMRLAMREMPIGKHEAIVVAPLRSEKFEPDVVLVYATPAQMMMILCGLQRVDYTRFQFFFVGEGSCTDSITECYLSGKPALTIPCYGERRFGGVAEDELVLALPPNELDRAINGINALSSVGLRYPIVPYGSEADPAPALQRLFGPEGKPSKVEKSRFPRIKKL